MVDTAETVNRYEKSLIIKYKKTCPDCGTQYCCDGQCIDDMENCCENKTNINIRLTYEIYNNYMVVSLSSGFQDWWGADSYSVVDTIYRDRNTNGIFKCPEIEFQSRNQDLYICDSVVSECTNCSTGKAL
jgi:hypothetical protein